MQRHLVLIAALTATACGSGQNELGVDEALRVAEAEAAIAGYCAGNGSHREHRDGIDTLVNVFRRNPDALLETGRDKRTVRQVLEDRASALDTCDRDAARRLDRVLR